jgi:hypothetical protein
MNLDDYMFLGFVLAGGALVIFCDPGMFYWAFHELALLVELIIGGGV